jgi:UDP-2-acetamido-3-amino-2,3-dideoxy-glucuronate N-acetyltransferase
VTDSISDAVFVHQQALCESSEVGARTRVWAFAHVMEGARIGSDCNICDHVFVETGAVIGSGVTVKNGVLVWDGVTIEDDVLIGPNVVFTNDRVPRAWIKKERDQFLPTVVRRGATIGANATIVCGTTIGTMAFVGAGSLVSRNIPPYALAYGNPVRLEGWICECGLSLPDDLRCSCGRAYALALGSEGLYRIGGPASIGNTMDGREA